MEILDSGTQKIYIVDGELLAKFTKGRGVMCMMFSQWYKYKDKFINAEYCNASQSVYIENIVPSIREGWHKWDLDN